MTRGIHKKLAKARDVCQGAGFLLMKLESQFGDEFSEGMRIQVKHAINECRQQGAALMAITAKNAVEAERMHERREQEMGDAA